MTDIFSQSYADAYDPMYGDKKYDTECELLHKIFDQYAQGRVRRVLDLGCGTGNHALPLLRRGYEVVGVDRSPEMLRVAASKSVACGLTLPLHQSDIRALSLADHFDAVLMMFAVLGYQLNNSDVLAALGTARSHLADGGLLVFDIWYGPAVLTQRPAERVRKIETQDGLIVRKSSGELDIQRHRCSVHFNLNQFNGSRLVRETAETHLMRYFFPLELELFLDLAGLKLLDLRAFPSFDRPPDETTWNAIVVAGTA